MGGLQSCRLVNGIAVMSRALRIVGHAIGQTNIISATAWPMARENSRHWQRRGWLARLDYERSENASHSNNVSTMLQMGPLKFRDPRPHASGFLWELLPPRGLCAQKRTQSPRVKAGVGIRTSMHRSWSLYKFARGIMSSRKGMLETVK